MAQWNGEGDHDWDHDHDKHDGKHDDDHGEIDDIGDIIDYFMDASVLQLSAKASVFTAAVLSCLF